MTACFSVHCGRARRLSPLTIQEPFSGLQLVCGTISKGISSWDLGDDTACCCVTSLDGQELSKGLKNTKVTELNHLEKVTCLKECLCTKASLWDLDVSLSFFWKGSRMGEAQVGSGGSQYWEMKVLLPNPEREETAERFCGLFFWTNQKYAAIVKMAFQGLTALLSNDLFPSRSWGLEAWCVGTWSTVLEPAGSSGLETYHCWTHRVALLLIST